MSPNSPFTTHSPLILIGALVFCGILAYGAFAASPYLRGPSLIVDSPKAGETVASPTVVIRGSTERVSYLSINDMPVPLLEDGTFAVERAYPTGYTVLVVRARDRFDRELTKTIQFLHTSNITTHGIQKESGAEAESESN